MAVVPATQVVVRFKCDHICEVVGTHQMVLCVLCLARVRSEQLGALLILFFYFFKIIEMRM